MTSWVKNILKESIERSGFHVRDLYVDYAKLNALPQDKQDKIAKLVDEYNKLNYLDARTEIGPDQWARSSDKQRDKIASTSTQAFVIEQKIKHLLRPDGEVSAENKQEEIRKLTQQIDAAKSQIKFIESMGKTAHKPNGQFKIGYQRTVDDYSQKIKDAEDKLKTLNEDMEQDLRNFK